MRENGMRLHIPIIYKNQTLTLSLKYMSNALREEISLQSWQQMHSSSEKKKTFNNADIEIALETLTWYYPFWKLAAVCVSSFMIFLL